MNNISNLSRYELIELVVQNSVLSPAVERQMCLQALQLHVDVLGEERGERAWRRGLVVILSRTRVYKPCPAPPDPDPKLYNQLLSALRKAGRPLRRSELYNCPGLAGEAALQIDTCITKLLSLGHAVRVSRGYYAASELLEVQPRVQALQPVSKPEPKQAPKPKPASSNREDVSKSVRIVVLQTLRAAGRPVKRKELAKLEPALAEVPVHQVGYALRKLCQDGRAMTMPTGHGVYATTEVGKAAQEVPRG